MADIRFQGISVWRVTFPLRLTFSHNLATRDRAETLLLRIRTAAGADGHGQALPRAYLTGESLESVADDISRRWWPRLKGLSLPAGDPVACRAALEPLRADADAQRRTASYAAVEMAALDAFAREAGISLAPAPPPVLPTPLVGVVSSGSPRKAYCLARLLRLLGYRRFKVKVGGDKDRDDALLAAVRRAVGGDAWLAVDANAAWEWDEAIRRMADLERFGVALVEEPLTRAAAADADFARLEREAGLPVMADESLCTLADAEALLARGSPSWWNLRFAKNGGFAAVEKLRSLASARGVRLYGGVLVGETSLLAAAGVLAFGGIVECAEYGFPRVFLKGDPFRGGPGGYGGAMRWRPAGRPGLGVAPRGDLTRLFGEPLWRDGGSE